MRHSAYVFVFDTSMRSVETARFWVQIPVGGFLKFFYKLKNQENNVFGMFSVELSRRARKGLDEISDKRIDDAIKVLELDPVPAKL